MLYNISPDQTNEWQQLKAHSEEMKKVHLADLFKKDPKRFDAFSIAIENILFDYSKNHLNADTLALLLQLANACRLPDAIKAMFNGEPINATEGRAVLHTALRNFSGHPMMTDGKDVMPDVQAVLNQMRSFCNK